MTEKSSRIQQWGWWRWLLTAALFTLVLAVGLVLSRTDYFHGAKWDYWLLAGELIVAMALVVCLVKATRLRAYLLVGLTVQAFTVGIGLSRIALRDSGYEVQDTSLGMNPEAHRRLPGLKDILYDGTWASKDTRRFLERCRKQYPLETKYIDTYIAACYFWQDDAERGERALCRLGLQPELLKYYERRGRWDKIEQMAQDPQDNSTARVSAWWTLAKRAERETNASAAKVYYLQALEHCPGDPSVADLRKAIWQTVRDHLGETISREQYAASLNTWAARVSDQDLLESIAFELGKLQLLAKLPGKAEVKP